MKPAVTCVCATLPRVKNRTRIRIIQHPRERFHAIGTARLLALGLENSRLDVAWLDPAALEPSRAGAALLYPAADARELETLEPSERPSEIVIVDGTWHQAKTLVREIDWLRGLPAVKLRPLAPSRYRIRAEPRFECLSTVEAVVSALELLEPDTIGLEDLIDCFDRMIDTQLEYVAARVGPRRTKRERRRCRTLPRALAERFDDLVVVYAETAPGVPPAFRRRLLRLSALRPATGELFDRMARFSHVPGLDHMGISHQQLERSDPLPALCAAWQSFRRPNDLVAAWNQSSLDALADAGLEPSGLSLKAVYSNAVVRAPGTLDAVIEREALTTPELPLSGRAAVRLANAAKVASYLHARATRMV